MFAKHFLTEEAKDELIKITEIEKDYNRDDLIYKICKKKKEKRFDFQRFTAITSLGREIYNDYLTLEDALEEQINLKNKIDKSKESTKPQKPDKKENIGLTFENSNRLL